MMQSSMITERKSTFQAYAVDIQDEKQVQEAYYKVEKLHPGDSHIICAYRIPDQSKAVPNECIDD